MGRKGGGRAAFMKAAQARNLVDSSCDEDIEAKKATGAETIPTESKIDVKSEEVPEFSHGEDETKGQMTQRHKREMKALKDRVKRMGKKGKEEGALLLKEMEERHGEEMKALEEVGCKAVEEITLSLYSADIGEQRKTKAQKRREKMIKEEIEREQRIAEENEAMGESDREAEEKALRAKLVLSSLAIKDIPSDGHCLYRSIGMSKQQSIFFHNLLFDIRPNLFTQLTRYKHFQTKAPRSTKCSALNRMAWIFSSFEKYVPILFDLAEINL
jgi:hypothetical protein